MYGQYKAETIIISDIGFESGVKLNTKKQIRSATTDMATFSCIFVMFSAGT
jgi:hypothetical protein